MTKRMQLYKVGNFNYKPLAYITLNFTNGKEIEDCVKDIYKPHIIKLKSDTLCHLTLTKLKESILTCIDRLNDHICNCMICKKTYKFKNLDTPENNEYMKISLNALGSYSTEDEEKDIDKIMKNVLKEVVIEKKGT
jgi:hypothetical protein